MFRHIHTTSMVAGAMLLFTGGAQAVNIAVNGGFESGFTPGWTDVLNGTIAATNGPSAPGSSAAFLSTVSAPGDATAKQANAGAGLLIPGANITVSWDVRGSLGPGGVGFVELFSELSGGGTSKSEILGGGPIGGPLALNPDPNVWTTFSFTTTLGPDVSGGASVLFKSSCGAVGGCFADLYFDNLTMETTVVPVPAAVWLFGSGLLGLVGVARRRRKG